MPFRQGRSAVECVHTDSTPPAAREGSGMKIQQQACICSELERLKPAVAIVHDPVLTMSRPVPLPRGILTHQRDFAKLVSESLTMTRSWPSVSTPSGPGARRSVSAPAHTNEPHSYIQALLETPAVLCRPNEARQWRLDKRGLCCPRSAPVGVKREAIPGRPTADALFPACETRSFAPERGRPSRGSVEPRCKAFLNRQC